MLQSNEHLEAFDNIVEYENPRQTIICQKENKSFKSICSVQKL